MSKAIYVSFPIPGHVNPTLGLVEELVNRGEEVVYFSSIGFKNLIESTGASFREFIVSPPDEQRPYYPELPDRQAGADTARDSNTNPLNELYGLALSYIHRGRLITEYNQEMFKAENADYMIHDAFVFCKEVPANLGLPAVSSFTGFCVGPASMDIAPEPFIKAAIGKPEISLSQTYSKTQINRMLELLNMKLRQAMNIKNCNLIDVITGREELNIVYTSKDFLLYPESFDETFKFVGRCNYKNREPVSFPKEILGEEPVIFISLGTIFNDRKDLFDEFIRTFDSLPYRVIMSVGDRVDFGQFQNIPKNIFLGKYVPQLEILKHAAAFITHGGANSIHEAAENGVPVVVIPQSVDQFTGAETVEKYRAGIYLRSLKPDAREIRSAVLRVINEPDYRNNMLNVQSALTHAGGAKGAVDEIFDFKRKKSI